MAVKATRLPVLPILLLSVGLLLSGCAEKDQIVSEPMERSDFFSADSSVPGSTTDSTNESKDIVPAVTAGPDAVNANSTGADGINNNPEGKTENASGGPKAGPEVKAADAQGIKSGANEKTAGNADKEEVQENSSNKALQNSSSTNKETQEQSSSPGSDSGQTVEIKFSEMYSGSSSRGLKFSDKLTGLDGKKVVITGYMAPPLKPSFDFFVLTRQPMAICPFCSSDASWPEDIILVYLQDGETRTPTDSVLTVTGTLELGSHTDPDTGFVSQARIYSDKIKVVR